MASLIPIQGQGVLRVGNRELVITGWTMEMERDGLISSTVEARGQDGSMFVFRGQPTELARPPAAPAPPSVQERKIVRRK
jgi:hypothetical protein